MQNTFGRRGEVALIALDRLTSASYRAGMVFLTATGWFTLAALVATALPLTGAWLLTSTSPRQRAIGLQLDRIGKIAVVTVFVVGGIAWLCR